MKLGKFVTESYVGTIWPLAHSALRLGQYEVVKVSIRPSAHSAHSALR